jgi:hypothetical protein
MRGLSAQTSLFVPEISGKPMKKGTRTGIGEPGARYWQNRADYVISASLEPKSHRLSGEETITYFNNSPDTLKMIRIKLQHDRYRKGAGRAGDVTAGDVTDEGVRIDWVKYNGAPVDEKQRRRFTTFMDVQVKDNPVLPGSSVSIQVKWSTRCRPEKTPRASACATVPVSSCLTGIRRWLFTTTSAAGRLSPIPVCRSSITTSPTTM